MPKITSHKKGLAKNILLLLLCSFVFKGYSQRENVWVFSHYMGLNFNVAPPAPFVQGNLGSSTGEACASVSDNSGNLLFYTNGSRVWNVNHTAMPNGNNLTGLGNAATLSTSQGAAIVPFPDNNHKYYVFSIVENELPERGRLYYSVVDMTLNGGLGDVVTGLKGILVDTGMAEKMTAVEGNACNVWLVVRTLHERIYAYEISSAGVNMTPVVSFVGNPVNMTDNYTGQITFSPDRRSLAETSLRLPALTPADGMWLYDFDPGTGLVTNSRQLQSSKAAYGVCFSPDNSKLYVQADSLYQYNVALGSTATIIASKVALKAYNGLSALKRGPDGKVYSKYVTMQGAPVYSMACVQQPNQPGLACAFNAQQIMLTGSYGPGLPGDIAHRIVPKDTLSSRTYDSLNCFGSPPLVLSAVISSGYNHKWDNGATGQQRTVTLGGIYRVGYNLSPCVYRIDSFIVWSPTSISTDVQMTAACKGDVNGKAWLNTGSPAGSYTVAWSRATDTTILSTTDSLLQVPAGNYKVHLHTESGCDTTVYFTIPVEEHHVSFTVSDTLVCINEEIVLKNTSAAHFTEYRWLTGDGNASNEKDSLKHKYLRPGVYEVLLIGKGPICTDTASRQVTVDTPASGITFTIDKHELCTGDKITITPQYDSTVVGYRWSFGDGMGWTSNSEKQTQHAYDNPGKMIIKLLTQFRACAGTSFEDSVRVHPLPSVDLGPDSVICLDGRAIMLSNHRPYEEGDRYTWNTGARSKELKVVHHGNYGITVTNKHGCSTTEWVAVKKDCYIDIPNAFTPNGDGINDYFFPRQLLSENITSFSMKVFNRWGQVVFETQRRDGRGWDGRFNGREQPGGVYLYLIEAGIAGTHQEKYQGNVTLIR